MGEDAAGLALAGRIAEWRRRFEELEPAVHAFVAGTVSLERVEEAVRESAAENAASPLAGGLLGVKDIFHVDGWPTRAGSRLPAEELAGAEAESVARLRRAGAVVVGKTVTTEFAYFAPGPTRNPHAPDHTPGGSSSGSAAAVAAGLCDLALGTQTIGSIGRPAAFCGIVGYKPSYDRIPRDGVIPLAPSVDHVGLFARAVGEIAAAAPAVVDGWRGPAGAPARLRLGVPVGEYLEKTSREGKRHFDGVLRSLRRGGWEVVEVPVMTDFEAVDARHRLLVAAEAAAVHADWFARFGELYAPKTVELIRRGQGVAAQDLVAALAGRGALRAELEAAMEEHDLELWLSPPATGPAPLGLDSTGDPVMNLPWTHSGLPTVVVPAGRSAEGLPMGLQLAARFGSDEELLAAGAAIEAGLRAAAAPPGEGDDPARDGEVAL